MNTKKYIIGYIGDSGLSYITKEDALRHTHFNIAFGHIVDGKVTVTLKNMDKIATIREYNPDIKVILSVGGWGAGGFSEAASTQEGRELFAKTSVEAIEKYGLDGIDLDWEYPSYSEAGIASSKDDKVNFTLLLKEIREHLNVIGERDNKHYMLTIAVGADQYYVEGTEMDKAVEYLDYVQLMSYDMRGGFQTLTGHHTNLFNSTGDLFRISCDRSASIFENAGVPREKLLLGVAFYSRMWKDVPNINNGLFQMSPGNGGYGPDYSTLKEEYINVNGFERHWDDEAKAPYLYNGRDFITYDDEESIAHKCKYVLDTNLAGIMYWQFECDNTNTLIKAINEGLR